MFGAAGRPHLWPLVYGQPAPSTEPAFPGKALPCRHRLRVGGGRPGEGPDGHANFGVVLHPQSAFQIVFDGPLGGLGTADDLAVAKARGVKLGGYREGSFERRIEALKQTRCSSRRKSGPAGLTAFLVGMGARRRCVPPSSTNVCLALFDHSLQDAGNRRHLVTIRARSGDDHHRGRGAGAQFDMVWNLLDAHRYRYALRETDPLEGRRDGGQ